jgi:hypothetical protein
MKGTSINKKVRRSPQEEPKAALENKYIEDYLLSKGYRRKDLQSLPKEVAKTLMREASTYASLKLADIEARSKFRDKIHWPL